MSRVIVTVTDQEKAEMQKLMDEQAAIAVMQEQLVPRMRKVVTATRGWWERMKEKYDIYASDNSVSFNHVTGELIVGASEVIPEWGLDECTPGS